MTSECNGQRLTPAIRQEADGTWGVTVWFGGLNNFGTNVRRYRYATRAQARSANISHTPGDSSGRVA